ncbi:hypothetical protein DPMN_048942 [Dreissena polymorpha]|uniref:Uncharacterized protein n=1 Tax=Dreissena polymorpha TaxID=45954 RepID=A0A9D4DC11_DREPO|nr:hypothetical protein DPMN_048942 [Dreissena polymorpha]
MKSTKELPRYGSGQKSAGRTDSRTDDRTDNAKTISLRLWRATLYNITRVLTRKNAPPLGSYFHEDWTINVASRVLTRKNAPPPGGHFHEDWAINTLLGSHVFQANVTIFELIQDIIKTNLLTKFHADWTIHLASRG